MSLVSILYNKKANKHPLAQVKKGKGLIITHTPLAGSESLEISQDDVLDFDIGNKPSYLTNDIVELNNGIKLGMFTKNCSNKIKNWLQNQIDND